MKWINNTSSSQSSTCHAWSNYTHVSSCTSLPPPSIPRVGKIPFTATSRHWMRTFHHAPLRLPWVSPLLLELNRRAISTSSRQDPFYGHEQTSKLRARFITYSKYPDTAPPRLGRIPFTATSRHQMCTFHHAPLCLPQIPSSNSTIKLSPRWVDRIPFTSTSRPQSYAHVSSHTSAKIQK